MNQERWNGIGFFLSQATLGGQSGSLPEVSADSAEAQEKRKELMDSQIRQQVHSVAVSIPLHDFNSIHLVLNSIPFPCVLHSIP